PPPSTLTDKAVAASPSPFVLSDKPAASRHCCVSPFWPRLAGKQPKPAPFFPPNPDPPHYGAALPPSHHRSFISFPHLRSSKHQKTYPFSLLFLLQQNPQLSLSSPNHRKNSRARRPTVASPLHLPPFSLTGESQNATGKPLRPAKQ
ncbi:hypothetical protein HAX54_005705, partial [Datura stramonium]|nr:hypothetical protein [Datura stramonium]